MSKVQSGGARQQGFSLAEVLVVVAVIAVGFALTIPLTMSMVRRSTDDSSLVVVETFVRGARDRAVAERRNVELEFLLPNKIKAYRVELGTPVVRTLVGEIELQGATELLKATGVDDTPEEFAPAAAAWQFSGTQPVMFTSDGSLIDVQGDVTNGTFFMAIPGKPETSRAITIYGVTGLVKRWNWRGSQWQQ